MTIKHTTQMRNGLLLLHLPPPPPSFLSKHQQWPPPKHPNLNFTVSINPSLFRPQVHAKSRRWDSNAESFRTQNFDFNLESNWRDNNDDDDDDDDDDDGGGDIWSGIIEFFNDVWIFKVFRSYGWMLPAIISSLVLTTGLKAFLIALAIPVGQSALSLAFQKVWESTREKPKRKGRTRKNSRGRTASNFGAEKEKKERQRRRKSKLDYKTWVASYGVPVDKNTQDSTSFGGWEELDRHTEFKNRSTPTEDGKQKAVKSKLSRQGGRSDTPLFLRLLIAVFPFLGFLD